MPEKNKLAYSDTDLMTFGKYRDVPLQDVPASYLHWLYSEGTIHDVRLLHYIENNLDALKQEHPDGIWKKKGK